MTDIYNIKQRAESIQDDCQQHLDQDQYSVVEEYLRQREYKGISQTQLYKDIRSIRNLLEFRQKPFQQYEEEDIKDFMLHLKREGKRSRKMYWYGLKKFFEHLDKGDMFTDKPRFNTKSKLPEELLTKEEVHDIIEACTSLRDKAFFTTLYESGTRIGELLPAKIKQVQFDDKSGVLIVDGKTGMRRLRLVESIPLLAQWIGIHPRKDDDEAYLFPPNNGPDKPLEYNSMRKRLQEAKQRAEISKRVHFHLFRHSRATHLANHLTEQQLKIYMGWTAGSDMAQRYVHLSGKDVDDAIMNLYKDERRQQDSEGNQYHCPRCNTSIRKQNRYCGQCGMEL